MTVKVFPQNSSVFLLPCGNISGLRAAEKWEKWLVDWLIGVIRLHQHYVVLLNGRSEIIRSRGLARNLKQPVYLGWDK